MDVSIVGVVPCYNEELTIGKIISDFRKIVAETKIYVFDNNSTDKTVEIAKSSGAVAFTHGQGRGLMSLG